ncbi:ABC transporter ATP-binding protein [Clostridium polynesiense]|uniref:ABC transporter ATP-binding protein n=1 Tax=Clostridium polynesiense TaxID=1325933 RepID=UPI0006936842|nr:ABC transporter ATP-binding protein [Clostridium polynesiense]
MTAALKINSVSYKYPNKNLLLSNINLEIKEGEIVCLIGKSGCGKTTLLNIAAGLIKPVEGNVRIGGTDIYNIKKNKLSSFRGENIGYIFQSFNLLNNMNFLDNVAMPLELSGCRKRLREEKAEELLEALELYDKLDSYPYQLSGGEQQRAAIARALIRRPRIILADEPTGNLDSETERVILGLLKDIRKKYNTSMLIVTHDEEVSSLGDRIINIKDGRI